MRPMCWHVSIIVGFPKTIGSWLVPSGMPISKLAIAVAVLFVLPVFVGYWTRHLKIAVAVAVLATSAAAFAFWMSIAKTATLEPAVSVDGTALVVEYVGGECEDHRSVSVAELTDSIRIAITTRSFAAECSDVAVLRQVRIELAQPIGSREVMDAGCTEDRPECNRVLEIKEPGQLG